MHWSTMAIGVVVASGALSAVFMPFPQMPSYLLNFLLGGLTASAIVTGAPMFADKLRKHRLPHNRSSARRLHITQINYLTKLQEVIDLGEPAYPTLPIANYGNLGGFSH